MAQAPWCVEDVVAADMEKISRALGVQVKHFRHLRRLSQEQAAKNARVSLPTWSRIERGTTDQNFTLETIAAVADALGVSIADLFAGTREVADADTAPAAELAAILAHLDADGCRGLLTALRQLAAVFGPGR